MDPLAQFRRQSPPPSAHAGSGAAAEEYAPFSTKDRAARLRVRCAFEPSHALVYNCLLNVIYDDNKWTNFSLMFTFATVLVRGQNLAPVISAIELGAADCIQEFDEMRWRRPTDAKATIITTIQVIMQGDALSPETLAAGNRHQAVDPQRQAGHGA